MVQAYIARIRSILVLILCSIIVLSEIIVGTPLLAQGPVEPDSSEPAEGYWPTDFDADAWLQSQTSTHVQSAAIDLSNQVTDVQVTDAQVAEQQAVPDQIGQWSPVMNWPVLAIHASLLPNGKVMAWDATPDDFDGDPHTRGSNSTRVTVWDPVADTHLSANPNTESDLFCAGHALLPDGRLFAAGGDVGANDAIDKTNIFDPATNVWTRVESMSYPRWYPSVTELPTGEMLVTGGGPFTHEVWTTNGSYRTLTNAVKELPYYPWLQVAANGKVLLVGPGTIMSYLDTAGAGSWQNAGARDSVWRDYGSHAMYDVGKILVSGGGGSSKTAVIVNPNNASVTSTGSMSHGRRQHNLTVLADGSVLAIGGNTNGATLVDLNNGVLIPELWNPATGQWTIQAAMQRERQYHSTALLLPDGRVLSAGGGYCGDCNDVGYFEQNAEIFTPSYLFKQDGSGQLAVRPVINAAPAQVDYAQSFAISAAQTAPINKVSFLRLSSVTHSVNATQRYIPLSFTQSNGVLTAVAPASANVAPPGYYMLIIENADGVPSVAKFVQVGTDSIAPPPPPPGTTGSVVTVDARGEVGSESMALHINGQRVKEWNDVGTYLRAHVYQHDSFLTTEQIQVHFTNNANVAGGDRNLVVDKLTIDDTIYQTEAQNVIGKGVWNGSNCSTVTTHQVEMLACNGYFQYVINNTPPPTNNPPVLTNPGAQIATINDAVDLTLVATDADQDTIAFSATGLPAGLTINRNTGKISGSVSEVGSFTVVLAVSDGNGGSDNASFVWTVDYMLGDVDCDEQITSVDALFMLQYSVDLRSNRGGCPLTNPLTELNAVSGDVNGSGATDAVDALLTLQCVVGISNSFCGVANNVVAANQIDVSVPEDGGSYRLFIPLVNGRE